MATEKFEKDSCRMKSLCLLFVDARLMNMNLTSEEKKKNEKNNVATRSGL